MTAVKKNFRIGTHDAKTLIWWTNRRNKIDMDPPYQRKGRLWSESDKAYLIDSILNGYDIPKIYIADFTWGTSPLNKRNLPYAIIDGKQRFEAIFDFIDGKITLNDDFEYLEDPSLKLGGLSYQDLKKNYPEIAEEFENFNLTVMSVSALSVEPINNLFVRLNRSKPLTGAEIRNAMLGPAPEIIRQIASHDFFTENVRFQTKRAQDQNAAAKVLLFEYRGAVQETKKKTLDLFVDETKKESEERVRLASLQVLETLEKMGQIFLPKDRLLASSGVFPVYYWFIRGVPESQHQHVREFLVKFEKERADNRTLYLRHPQGESVDHKLLEYDDLNRSTNDLQSYRGRVQIIQIRFATYLA